MPQTAPSLHLQIRRGGYAPKAGFHFPTLAFITAGLASDVALLIAPALSIDVTIDAWEAQTALGTVVNGGILDVDGTWGNPFDDFKDMTHYTLRSEGSAGPSGFYLPGRANGMFIDGSPTVAFNTIVTGMIAGLIDLGMCDSEGQEVTGLLRYAPSRRPNVRMAP